MWRVLIAAALAGCTMPAAPRPFVIRVLDAETGRGVPLVELRTTNGISFHTDNAGVVAFDEPGLLGERVWFHVESQGYEVSADGFGFRGAALDTRAGGEATVRVKRLNIAERLYRVTGQGLYHHSQRACLPVPLAHPALNAKVAGQDSVVAVVCGGKIRWFWGDTNRPAYPLGHYGTSTATSLLPGSGGLDPAVGVDLRYAVDDAGFSRPAFELREPGAYWVHGGFALKDPHGVERVLVQYERREGLAKRLELGIAVFHEESERFSSLVRLPIDEERHPFGQAFLSDGCVYFATPYPVLRVRAEWGHVLDPARYEAFSCLAAGEKYDASKPMIARDASGRAAYAWRAGAVPVGPERQREMIRAGHLKPEEAWIRTKDVATGSALRLSRGSVRWNDHRRRWIMIASQSGGQGSLIGDVYYAEAKAPEGPWETAVKVVSHRSYSFYNPVHHAFFDQAGGRLIYFEGTYTKEFSDAPVATPRHDYNQVMYRLDLADPRLAPAQK
jgi:hypothetical protein